MAVTAAKDQRRVRFFINNRPLTGGQTKDCANLSTAASAGNRDFPCQLPAGPLLWETQ
jgi:hypothetical protein